jgi:hypothetical protein
VFLACFRGRAATGRVATGARAAMVHAIVQEREGMLRGAQACKTEAVAGAGQHFQLAWAPGTNNVRQPRSRSHMHRHL